MTITTTDAARRIVVADDDPDILELLRLNLEANGHRVLTASDGAEARELVLRTLPELVILDVCMPELDGLEVLAAIKAHGTTRDIPVVMLTARAGDTDVWNGWQAGADYYITKPFDMDELLRFISYLHVKAELA